MAEHEPEAWPGTSHVLAVQASMYTNEYSYDGSRGYQQGPPVNNGSYFFPSKGVGSLRSGVGIRSDYSVSSQPRSARGWRHAVFVWP